MVYMAYKDLYQMSNTEVRPLCRLGCVRQGAAGGTAAALGAGGRGSGHLLSSARVAAEGCPGLGAWRACCWPAGLLSAAGGVRLAWRSTGASSETTAQHGRAGPGAPTPGADAARWQCFLVSVLAV